MKIGNDFVLPVQDTAQGCGIIKGQRCMDDLVEGLIVHGIRRLDDGQRQKIGCERHHTELGDRESEVD